MADEAPRISEHLFRAKKRRKFESRRGESEVEDGGDRNDEVASPKNIDDATRGVSRTYRRPNNKKHGIAFTSQDGRRSVEQISREEMAMVPVPSNAVQDVTGNDRFVKPTGRVGVTEDKHMVAYVDSKLAEMRSSVPAPSGLGQEPPTAMAANRSADKDEAEMQPLMTHSETTASPSATTYQQAQARTTRAYQRPTKRRAPRARPEADVQRDSLIDQILQETQIPHYDRSAPSPHPAGGTADGDNDAALAEAFKDQLLADMENHKRRKLPAANAGGKPAERISSGPKLGGSRNQRERMRELQEAARGGGAKK